MAIKQATRDALHARVAKSAVEQGGDIKVGACNKIVGPSYKIVGPEQPSERCTARIVNGEISPLPGRRLAARKWTMRITKRMLFTNRIAATNALPSMSAASRSSTCGEADICRRALVKTNGLRLPPHPPENLIFRSFPKGWTAERPLGRWPTVL